MLCFCASLKRLESENRFVQVFLISIQNSVRKRTRSHCHNKPNVIIVLIVIIVIIVIIAIIVIIVIIRLGGPVSKAGLAKL